MTGRRGFWESEDAYVRRAADEAVDAATSAARNADARLSGQIRSTDGRINALAARVEGLSQAFDAFLEASELRRECDRYWAAAAVRAFVRAHIGALTGSGDPLPSAAGVVDVPGYWLPPAVQGLVGLLGQGGGRDTGADAGERLAEAGRRDAHRTAVFLVGVLGARGAGTEAEPWLAAALPPAGDGAQVTLAARYLWLAYASGVHGPAGRATLSEWLGGLAASVSPDDLEKALAMVGSSPEVPSPHSDSPRARNLRSQAIEDSLRRASAAAGSLAALRDALSGTSSTADAAPATPDPTPEVLLTALIEEGSAPEAELLRKAEALEARARRSAQREGSRQPIAWDMSVGGAADLLLADLFDTAEAAAVRRTTALTALARPLAALADTLLARTADLPATLQVSIPWQRPITLDHATPFAETLAAVHADIERTIAAESPGSGRKQAAVNWRRAEEQKQSATERLREAADKLADYRRQGEEIHAAAKSAYDSVMNLLGSHAEGAAPV